MSAAAAAVTSPAVHDVLLCLIHALGCTTTLPSGVQQELGIQPAFLNTAGPVNTTLNLTAVAIGDHAVTVAKEINLTMYPPTGYRLTDLGTDTAGQIECYEHYNNTGESYREEEEETF